MDTDELIAAQMAYYRARAGEYDDWFERREEYRISDEFVERWKTDVAELRAWLADDPPTGHVLEIAAGSGNWTGELLKTADNVTALDASPEMLEQLASKHDGVEQIIADIFSWDSPKQYDQIFFAFWLSHIPLERWKPFWGLVHRALRPGGRLWFIDNAHPDHASAMGPRDWPEAARLHQIERGGGEIHQRTLRDGSKWTMVKRYWWPGELTAELGKLGWAAQVEHTGFAFLHGTAQR